MHPILLDLGGVKIFSYGVMIALGFFVAYVYTCYLARRIDIDEDYITDIFLVIIVTSILGARFNYVVTHLDRYMANPIQIVQVWTGGMVYLGGFLGAIFGAILYLRYRRFEFGVFADMFGPAVPLAQALGRMGCFLNGCCFGLVCEPPWGMVFPHHRLQQPYLPTQIYEAIILVCLAIGLDRYYRRNTVPGQVMVGYLYLYSLERFLIEFIRFESVEESYIFGLTLAQSTCLVMLIPVIGYHLHIRKKYVGHPTTPAEAAQATGATLASQEKGSDVSPPSKDHL